MGARCTVFFRRSVAGVGPAELLAGAREADLYTIAENEDVPDELIRDALAQLRVENVGPATDFRHYRLHYRAAARQVDVERWSPGEAPVIAAEARDGVEGGGPVRDRIRAHLDQAIEVVSISFGSSPGERMGSILASEAARWLAHRFDGLVRAADGSWWALGRHGEYQPLGA